MKSVRASLSAIGLVAVLIGSMSASALAAAAHPVCIANHHECSQTTTIKPCCGDQDITTVQTGPATAKVTIDSALSPVTAVHSIDSRTPPPGHVFGGVQTARGRSSPVDLPILFARLLI